MNPPTPRVLLTTDAFALRPELVAYAEAKAARLFRHSRPRVHLVRINVKYNLPHSGIAFFSARATAEHEGLDHISHADGPEPETAINAAVGKLERALTAAAGLHKHALHREPAFVVETGSDA
jgi:hypothetical protein